MGNIVAKLSAAEIMIKFQETVAIFRSHIFAQGEALNERDSRIADLMETQKKFQKEMISANNPRTEMDQMLDTMMSSHPMSPSTVTQPVPVTNTTSPSIADNNTVIVKDPRDEDTNDTQQSLDIDLNKAMHHQQRLMISRHPTMNNTLSNLSLPHLLNTD